MPGIGVGFGTREATLKESCSPVSAFIFSAHLPASCAAGGLARTTPREARSSSLVLLLQDLSLSQCHSFCQLEGLPYHHQGGGCDRCFNVLPSLNGV